MRRISTEKVTEIVKNLCIKANNTLPDDVINAIKNAYEEETSKPCKNALKLILENINVSEELSIPLCQDTGMAVVFLEIGQEIFFEGTNINDAVNEGVRKGYLKGLLRCSVVSDPFNRINTNDNTPAIIHTEIVSGDTIKITVAPKGFGSENMSAIKMFLPSASAEDIIDFVVDVVTKAGSNPCPPIIVGIGIGGNFEHSAYLSKKALLSRIDISNNNEYYNNLQERILTKINKTGIGAQGFGGIITALGVNILSYPCHIAGLPVAVNICCHVLRHQSAII